MLKFKKISLLLIFLPFLILSCWGDSSPTSDKAQTVKVSGIVADKNGTGIGRVTVQITGTNFSATDTTDAAGVFNFRKISSGSYIVKATKESNVFKPSGLNIAIASSDIDTLRYTAAENRIHGKVMDIITNKGISNIKIIFYGDNTPFKDSTTTNINGEYEFFDLPVKEYTIDINSRDRYKNGDSSPFPIKVKTEDFAHPDISVQNFFMSSEVLQITSATFSEDTNTVELEWTKSRSNFCNQYLVCKTDNINTGFSGSGCKENSISIEITPRYRASLNNAKIIYYFIGAYYVVSEENHIMFSGPFSEPVSIKVAE